ncbi:hypothetical protein [Streptomyces sp. NPDC059861]|uniref:TetR/AcrR family transcriptional regulator n=1 Tax=Streptomyces sp. NPDC059861 TaxID=3346974 RepID=UPI003654A077
MPPKPDKHTSAEAPADGRRTPDREQPRGSLLTAADERFACEFQDTSVKEIATADGVTVLGVRSFRTTTPHCPEAQSPLRGRQDGVLGSPGTTGATLVERVLRRHDATRDGTLEEAFVMAARFHDPTQLASHAEALAHSLAERLEGPDVRLRAELATAQMLGLAVLEGVLPALDGAAPVDIVRVLGPAVQAVLDNPAAGAVGSKAGSGAHS